MLHSVHGGRLICQLLIVNSNQSLNNNNAVFRDFSMHIESLISTRVWKISIYFSDFCRMLAALFSNFFSAIKCS